MEIREKQLVTFLTVILSIFGLLAIYSAFSYKYTNALHNPLFIKQLIFVIIGLLLMNIVSEIDFKFFLKNSLLFYAGGIVLLIAMLTFLPAVKGRWLNLGLFSFQPSELMKIIFIVYISKEFAAFSKNKRRMYFINILSFIARTALLTLFPAILIFRQPDLGTGLSFVIVYAMLLLFIGESSSIFIFMFFFALGILLGVILRFSEGVGSALITFLKSSGWIKMTALVSTGLAFSLLFYILARFLIGLRIKFTLIAALSLVLNAGFLFSAAAMKMLKPYQIQRLRTFLNPYEDMKGSGWHVIQSKISIGSGGYKGKGLLKGTQNKMNFLPERHTDFIFSLISEEFGFLGSMAVLLSQFLILFFLFNTAAHTSSATGFYLSASVFSLFLTHSALNTGMNLGILPVTGIPLPFVSYGGSVYLSFSFLIGIVMNISKTTRTAKRVDVYIK